MKERLVDVKLDEKVLHTFPVSIDDPSAEAVDDSFKRKALDAAAHAKLVAPGRLSALTAEMHVGRGGPLEPANDPLGVLAETKSGLEQFVRDRAYYLWEQAGRPDGTAETFWHQAQHERWRERAYALWEREGRPHDMADLHWHRVCDFEQC